MLLLAISANSKGDNRSTDLGRVERIRKGDKKAFEALFFEYHEQLSRFSNSITKSREFARDAVQDVFLKFWRNRKEIDIQVSVKVYLYQAVRNQSLNLLDKQKNQQRLRENFLSEIKSIRVEGFEESNLNTEQIELIKKVWETVNKMPERRRLVFELHRKHGFSYKEIAKILEITVKTVENHMSQALQYLRENIEINKLK
ncbi:MAG: RNA polymerase subunit sigma-70 [Bacteroidetes bacterium]|jgi:RNA polymerase sigma-70 factor (ECF subfamily)|nr:RNA polymerase subunit sigma-70 [Bacteroidota bacterium]MAC06215.1 RNA polymerase subunit sigma-70 [Balneola sp.]MAO77203.1 RNA polymerase subunit sigma-70 [Balneola sp.]MBF62986.1 RNA polymerase subunit sigma-70 [Balneola sp.]HBZ38360.1 RNA polymerase sigma-70 factor [Balneola sp.]|tara:strand:- start:6786 stop:7385 length:600 start_codon:yes stop_codon:yes gene_type:complete